MNEKRNKRIENLVMGKSPFLARKLFWNLSKFPEKILPALELKIQDFGTKKEFMEFLHELKLTYIAENPSFNDILVAKGCEEIVKTLSIVIDKDSALFAYESARDAIFSKTKAVEDAIKFNNPDLALTACFSGEAIEFLTPFKVEILQLLRILHKEYLSNTRPVKYILKR